MKKKNGQRDEFDRLSKRCKRFGLKLTKFRRGYRVWGVMPDNKPTVMLDAGRVDVILRCLSMKEELAKAERHRADVERLHGEAEAINRAYTFRTIDWDTYSALWADLNAGFERLDRDEKRLDRSWDRLVGAR